MILLQDVRQELMQVHAYVIVEWLDELLTWDPANFSGVSRLTVDADDIWTPTLVIYNRCDVCSFERVQHCAKPKQCSRQHLVAKSVSSSNR